MLYRFIVAQSRAAVSVEQPGPLLANLEALIGTDTFQQRTQEASQSLTATRAQANATIAVMERFALS